MIVFPMAGLSARFTAAGYSKPKYMLPFGDHCMFVSAVIGFSDWFESEPFLFICRNVADTADFVRRELAAMSPSPAAYEIIVLDYETSGQAETVYEGLRLAGVSSEEPLTIFNIDSHRSRYSIPEGFDPAVVDGFIEVFRGEGEQWSFVRSEHDGGGEHGVAAEVAEKVRISDLCSSGLYYFNRTGLFQALYEETLDKNPSELQGGERYIAPLYNAAIQQGRDIRYVVVPREVLTFTGTPQEYEEILEQVGNGA